MADDRVELSPDDFDLDADGNINVKNEKVRNLKEVVQKMSGDKGPMVKVAM